MGTLIVAGLVILLIDQYSKNLVQLHLAHRTIEYSPVLHLRYVPHQQRTYHRELGRAGLAVLWCFALLSAVLLRRSGVWFQEPAALIGLGLALGGAAGNLCDILRLRFVIDFIDVGRLGVFNLADMAIVTGLVLAFLG